MKEIGMIRVVIILLLSVSTSASGLAQVPSEFDVTGGGSFCTGGPGVPVGLSGSEIDVDYDLFRDGAYVTTIPGDGAEISFGDQPAGIYTVTGSNADGNTPMNGTAVVIEYPLPAITVSSAPACSPDLLTWSVGVTVSSGTVTTSSGTANNTVGNVWSITDIPAGTDIDITVNNVNNCENTINVVAPDCSCPEITAPISGGNVFYCEDGAIPDLTASVGSNETVDWYDLETGGNLLLSGSLSYTPIADGTYFAEARNISSNCISSIRTAMIVTMYPLPVATLTCSDPDNIIYSGTTVIFSAAGGTIYEFKVDDVPVQNGVSNTYTTNSLTDGEVISVTVTAGNGCSSNSEGIAVSVIPMPPEWIINPGDYIYNGMVTARVFIDFSAVISGYLGAFIGTECRGIAEPVYYSTGGYYLFNLKCYSNSLSGESLAFRFYDLAGDIVYDLDKTILFSSGMTMGSSGSPVDMYNTVNINIPLQAGWNWISLNAQKSNMSLGSLLPAVTNSGDYIKSQVKSATYFSGFGWFGSLTAINPISLYKIKVLSNSDIDFAGVPVNVSSTSINLVSGWNWIGYLPQTEQPVEDALSSLTIVENDYIKSSTESATFYNSSGWFGTLTQLSPYQGYMIKVTNPGTLKYPEAPAKNGKIEAREITGFRFEPSRYEFNGSLTASVIVDGNLTGSENDLLIAYVNDEIRGVTRGTYFKPENIYLFPLMVHSNTADGEQIEFRYLDAVTGNTYPCREKVVFKKDMVIANALKSLELNVSTGVVTASDNFKFDAFELKTYPNPFSGRINIDYSLTQNSDVRLSIFDINGRPIETLVDEMQQAGKYSVQWIPDSHPGGVYIIRLQSGMNRKISRITLIR